jgi:nitroreductase
MTTVTEALHRRISTRRFLPSPLAPELVREILDTARWAPSGGNLQPWHVIAVAGKARDDVVKLAQRHLQSGQDSEEGDRPIYPPNLWEPYRTRRYKVGEDMYVLLGIGRDEKPRRLAHVANNFTFFGAPVGVFFAIDERMGHGQWAHLGMYMQSVALAAIERGVECCFQESWARVRRSLATHFMLPPELMIYCGMALGHADPSVAVNRLRSDRAPLEEFASFRGFDR